MDDKDRKIQELELELRIEKLPPEQRKMIKAMAAGMAPMINESFQAAMLPIMRRLKALEEKIIGLDAGDDDDDIADGKKFAECLREELEKRRNSA